MTAINRRAKKSRFASRARTGSETDGVAIFGGDGDPHRHPFIDMGSADAADAVVGAFSTTKRPLPLNMLHNLTLNDPDRSNRTGWVYWSGTSFATPAVSGLAANVWAAHPQWSGSQVRQRILEVAASDPDAAYRDFLGGGRILITQHRQDASAP